MYDRVKIRTKEEKVKDEEIRNLRKLLEKLKQLKEEDRVFLEGEKKAKKNEETNHRASLTSIAGVVYAHLLKQVDPTVTPNADSIFPGSFEKDIKLIEEFLAVFEEKGRAIEGETVIIPLTILRKVLNEARIGVDVGVEDLGLKGGKRLAKIYDMLWSYDPELTKKS